jgi:hypothetical protein
VKYGIPLILCFAFGCLMQVGCDSPTGPDTLSAAFIKFDPQRQFEAHGFSVEQTKVQGRVGQEATFGWRPFQGSIVLPRDSSGCELVAQAVRNALLQVVDGPCRDELKQLPERRRGEPFYGMLRYSDDGMHGLVYVWLFPDESETRINYAILIQEGAANETKAI